eukprot:GHRR01029240.1.p2 GENE.GHRR01029240.1~~GHRR01029240.1.p2  ORF type:complete len:138 (+),score=59.68 GHRR01029240.1:1121-1534(+)
MRSGGLFRFYGHNTVTAVTASLLQVEVMQHELQELQPVLATTAKEVEEMMVVIAHDKEDAANTKKKVEQQERDANEQAAAAKAIAGMAFPEVVDHDWTGCMVLNAHAGPVMYEWLQCLPTASYHHISPHMILYVDGG